MNNTDSTNTTDPILPSNSTDPAEIANQTTTKTVLALKKFHLLPIDTASDVETAEAIAPRVLGVFFFLLMCLGVAYTVYFILKQVYMFTIAYRQKVEVIEKNKDTNAKTKKTYDDLFNYSNDAGLNWAESRLMTLGNLRLLNFSLLWCDEEDFSDIYQVTSKLTSQIRKHEYAQAEEHNERTDRKLAKLKSAVKIANVVTWVTLASQILYFAATFQELLESRVYNIYGSLQVLLRGSFVMVIFLVSFNEISSIKYQEYTVFRGVFEPLQAKIQMIQILLRYIMVVFGLYVICIYVLTDGKDEEGSKMDQIKDFAAFVIVFDLDTIICGPFLNNFFNPSDLELHFDGSDEASQAHKDEVDTKVVENA